MKQLITILLCLFTLFAEAQVNTNDTNKYFKSYDYGFSYRRLQAREAFIMPTDTVINKLGAVSLNGAIYLGNGIKWTSIGGGGIDTTSLSNRINKKIDSLKRSSDSVYAFINGVKKFQYKDSTGTTPTLQQVTTAGALTTNPITVPYLYLGLGNSLSFNRSGNDALSITNSTTGDNVLEVNNTPTGGLIIGGGTSPYLEIQKNPFENVVLTASTTSGIIPISVNGYTANSAGAITIPTIDTSNKFVNRLERTPGKDSIIYFVGANRFAIKDSVGVGGVPYTGATQNVDLGSFKISAQSFQIEGTNGLGHIHLKHQSSNATATGQSTALFANSNGDLKYKNAGNYYSTLKTQQTADRIYTFQNKSYTIADSSDLTSKLNATDTTSLSNRINLKLNISDTATMLSPYAKNNLVATKLNATDTTSLSNRINLKLNISDTATMLSKYLRKTDTASLSNRINLKLNATDTASLSNRINLKLNISDTASLSTRIETKLTNLDLLQSLSLGFKAEPYGCTYANVTSQLTLTSPRLYFYPFNWNVSDSIRGIAFLIRGTTTLTSTNYNGVAIYSLSGGTLTRLTFTANSGTFWDGTSNTWKTNAITPYYLPKGVYYLGYEASGSAGLPTIASGTIMQAGFIEPPSAVNANGIKISSFISNATTTPPSSVAFSTTTTLQQIPYFILY